MPPVKGLSTPAISNLGGPNSCLHFYRFLLFDSFFGKGRNFRFHQELDWLFLSLAQTSPEVLC